MLGWAVLGPVFSQLSFLYGECLLTVPDIICTDPYFLTKGVVYNLVCKLPTCRGWNDCSVVTATCRGPGISSQYPFGASQLSMTPVPESSAVFWSLQTVGTDMVDKSPRHRKYLSLKNNAIFMRDTYTWMEMN